MRSGKKKYLMPTYQVVNTPVRTSGAVIWQVYKFPGPSIKLTVEELLTIAENLKGLKVELKEGE